MEPLGLTGSVMSCPLPGGALTRQVPLKEIADQGDHFVGLVFQGEVAGVEEVKLGVGQVALVRMRTFSGEDLVVRYERELDVLEGCLNARRRLIRT